MYQFNREEYEKRMQWFVNARFGMFIHWGLYAIPARGEWVRSFEEIPKEDSSRKTFRTSVTSISGFFCS